MLANLMAAGGLGAAVAASTCCVVPLSLAALGVGTAWVSALSFLAPYQTGFRVAAIVMLGAAFWLIYRPRRTAADGAACPPEPSRRWTKTAAWIGAVVVGLAVTSAWWERFVV